MNVISHVRSSRGLTNGARRAKTIFSRFGVSPQRLTSALHDYLDVTDRYGCTPTFPTTAVLIERHPRVFQELKERGVELAIHGCVHANYRLRDRDEQRRDFRRAMELFRKHGIAFTGFRSPYLNWNADTMSVLAELGFEYASNRSQAWDVVPPADGATITPSGLAAYEKVLRFYSAGTAEEELSLPAEVEGILDLPVAMPDDEATSDRLGVDNVTRTRLWTEILTRTHQTGELMVLNLHPERGSLCAQPLSALLQAASRWRPHVWTASMGEIAQWWRAREETSVSVRAVDEGRFEVRLQGDARAALLVQNVGTEAEGQTFPDGSFQPRDRGVLVDSPRKPVVGVHPACPPMVPNALRQLGYVYETSEADNGHGLYIDEHNVPRNPRQVYRLVASSGAPLVRVAPWPKGAASALSITGDIDSITLGDFFRRVIEA